MPRPRAVILTKAAALDLADARNRLTQPGPGARAVRKLASLGAALRDLRQHPCRWSGGEHDGTRERQIGDYRLVYEVEADTGDDGTAGDVVVLRVFGPRQSRGDPRESDDDA